VTSRITDVPGFIDMVENMGFAFISQVMCGGARHAAGTARRRSQFWLLTARPPPVCLGALALFYFYFAGWQQLAFPGAGV
jgi:hypothetical protein